MTDTQTIAVYDAQSKAYADLEESLTPDTHLRDFMTRLPDKGHVLDLGCGPGRSAAIMRDHGLKVDAVDASMQMVAMANSRYAINARQAYFEDIDMRSSYAGIWASFSLLHASANTFPKILTRLHLALQPAGIFHIGMKLGCGSSRDKLGRLYTYYSEDDLQQLLLEAGFDIIDVHLGEGRGLAGTIDPWIRILSKHCGSKI